MIRGAKLGAALALLALGMLLLWFGTGFWRHAVGAAPVVLFAMIVIHIGYELSA